MHRASIQHSIINTPRQHKLKIISINVNSLIQNQRRDGLLNFTETHKPDIVLINETKVNPKYKIHSKDFNLVRNDRANSKLGGGTEILIKKTVNMVFVELHIPHLKNASVLETSIIKLSLPHQVKLYIIAAYAPGNNKKNVRSEFQKVFASLELDNPKNFYILAGDLNAKHSTWKNSMSNPRGTFLNLWLEENKIQFKAQLYNTDLPSFPRGNSYLDICIIDCRILLETKNNANEIETIP